MVNKKKEVVILGLMVVLIIAVLGVSYAAFRFTGEGTKLNTITTGSITMSYEESSNTISLNGALPTTDETGKKRLNSGEYFDFTVSSTITGDVNINYEISAKEVGNGTIDGSNIKLYLTRLTDDGEEEIMTPRVYSEDSTTNSYTGRPSGEMSLYTSSMNSSESNRYRLRMYVDEDYNPQGDGGNLTFSVQINVYGKDGLSMEDRMMMAYDSSNPSDFHTDEYKSKITSIVTKGDTIIPEGVIESWDISEKQNESVIAYIEDDGTGAGTYKVTIGGEGSIIANYDMGDYFRRFINVETIDLSYLDTNLTTDMSYMFASTYLLGETMSLKNIIFGENFNTINVVNMSSVFLGCDSLIKLDLQNFSTSKVETMFQMFMGCESLEELSLNSFDTSNVTNMAFMFAGCSNLVEVNLSKFDTANVSTTIQMFDGCTNLKRLDLTNFNTSKITNYDTMFDNMTNITEILVTRDKWTIPNSAITNSGVTDFTYV